MDYDHIGAATLWFPLAMHSKLNPGRWTRCVDCGLDKGQYSNHYATMFDNVISIDGILREETKKRLGDLSNVTLVESCLSDTVGDTVTWYEFTENQYLSTISEEQMKREVENSNIDTNTINMHKIETNTLDNIVNCNVDFLKVDCEQVDYNVILGAENIISSYKPTIQVEASHMALEQFLFDLGYYKLEHTEHNMMDRLFFPK